MVLLGYKITISRQVCGMTGGACIQAMGCQSISENQVWVLGTIYIPKKMEVLFMGNFFSIRKMTLYQACDEKKVDSGSVYLFVWRHFLPS
jgi:hypothetical protein